MESGRGVVRGVRVNPTQRGSAELSGGQLPLAGGQLNLPRPGLYLTGRGAGGFDPLLSNTALTT